MLQWSSGQRGKTGLGRSERAGGGVGASAQLRACAVRCVLQPLVLQLRTRHQNFLLRGWQVQPRSDCLQDVTRLEVQQRS